MSATPPPFEPRPLTANRSSGAGKACLWIAVIGLLSCVALVVAGFFAFRNVMGQVSPLASCEMTFDAADKALRDFAADNGGKLPKAASWMDDVQRYYEARAEDFSQAPNFVKEMAPSAPDSAWGCKWSGGSTGIAFNVQLSEAELAKIANPTSTPLIFETEKPARNLAAKYDGGPKGKAPEVFGNRRKWVVYYVEGDNDIELDSSFGTTKP